MRVLNFTECVLDTLTYPPHMESWKLERSSNAGVLRA